MIINIQTPLIYKDRHAYGHRFDLITLKEGEPWESHEILISNVVVCCIYTLSQKDYVHRKSCEISLWNYSMLQYYS